MNISDRIANGTIESVIKKFNQITNTRHKFSNTENQFAVNSMLEYCNDDLGAIFSFFNEHTPELISNATTLGNHLVPAKELFFTTYKKPDANGNLVSPTPNVDFTKVMTDIALTALGSIDNNAVKDNVVAIAKAELDQYVKDTYGTIEHRVKVITPQTEFEFDGVVHHQFDIVYNLISAGENVYLTGPAGTGKSELCRQVAKAMNLDFYMSNAVTQEFKLTGFTDAMGVFHESSFYKAFKNGGLFLLDEMDASSPEALTTLNGALANGYFDFPAPIGLVYANENFRCIGAGNTYGEGATYEYNSRNQLDAASLDRFIFVRIDYDRRIEMACAKQDNTFVDFIHKLRDAALKCGIKLTVSYRGIKTMTKNKELFGDTSIAMQACLLKSLTIDDLNVMKSYVRDCGEYTTAYDKLISSMN